MTLPGGRIFLASSSRTFRAWSFDTPGEIAPWIVAELSCWKALELSRLGGVLQSRKGGKLNHPTIRTAHINVFELIDGQSFRAFDLRDYLVTAALVAEPIDVISAQHRGKVHPDLLEVKSKRCHLVAIEDDLGLRLIILQVGVRKHEDPALEGLGDKFVGHIEKLPRLGSGGDYQLDGKIAATRKRWRCDRE